jgi:hypothetical protein
VPALLKRLHQNDPRFDLSLRHGRWELSYLGLPVAWQDQEGSVRFDILASRTFVDIQDPEMLTFLEQVRAFRSFPPKFSNHPYYRYRPERWLESLVLKEHTRINPDFISPIYAQVPTLLGGERRILDLLTATRSGRLAIVELKVAKKLGILFQALEYWTRVRIHSEHGDFQRRGYFTGENLRKVEPLVYLVAPLFEYHSVLSTIRRHLDVGVRFECVGVNLNWREGLRIIRRFSF